VRTSEETRRFVLSNGGEAVSHHRGSKGWIGKKAPYDATDRGEISDKQIPANGGDRVSNEAKDSEAA
jgi:hypothetical protein